MDYNPSLITRSYGKALNDYHLDEKESARILGGFEKIDTLTQPTIRFRSRHSLRFKTLKPKLQTPREDP